MKNWQIINLLKIKKRSFCGVVDEVDRQVAGDDAFLRDGKFVPRANSNWHQIRDVSQKVSGGIIKIEFERWHSSAIWMDSCLRLLNIWNFDAEKPMR